MNRKVTPTVITLSAPLGKMDDLFWVELLREGTWHYDNPALPGGKFTVTKKDLKEFKKNYDAGVKGYLLPVNNEHTGVDMKEAEGWSDGKPLPQNVVGWLRGVKEGKSLTGSDAIFGLLSFEDPDIHKLADSGQVKFVSCELNLSWANPEDGNKPYKVIEGVAITARPYIKRMAPMKKVSRVGRPAVAVNLSEVACQADDGILIMLTDDVPSPGGRAISKEFLKQFDEKPSGDSGNHSFLYPGAVHPDQESEGLQTFGRAHYFTPNKVAGERNAQTYRNVNQAWMKALGAVDGEDMKRKLMTGDFDPTKFKVDSDDIKYRINDNISDENFGTEEAVGNKGFSLNPDLIPKPEPQVTMMDMSKFNMVPYDDPHPDAGKIVAHTIRNMPSLLRKEASLAGQEIADQNKFPIWKKENAWQSHDPGFLRELANHYEMSTDKVEQVARELEGRTDMSLWDAQLHARKALTPTQEHHGPHHHEFDKWAQDAWERHGNRGWPQHTLNHHIDQALGPSILHHGYDGIVGTQEYGNDDGPQFYAIHNKAKVGGNAGVHLSELGQGLRDHVRQRHAELSEAPASTDEPFDWGEEFKPTVNRDEYMRWGDLSFLNRRNEPMSAEEKSEWEGLNSRIEQEENARRTGDAHDEKAVLRAGDLIRSGRAHEVPERYFLKYHKTGGIDGNPYSRNTDADGAENAFTYLQKDKFTHDLGSFSGKDGREYSIRAEREPASYVKTDESGEIVRDETGSALMMHPEEVEAARLPSHNTTVAAFHGDHPVGYAGDEFGATGTYVHKDHQNNGLGVHLLDTYMNDSGRKARGARLGQMTSWGDSLTRGWHRKLVRDAASSGPQLSEATDLAELYHGTGEAQSIIDNGFDPSRLGQGTDQYGPGFYFTNKPSAASAYVNSQGSSPGIVKANVVMKNPIHVRRDTSGFSQDWPGVTRGQFHGMLNDAIEAHGEEQVLSHWGDVSHDGRNKVIARMRDAYVGNDPMTAMYDMFSDPVKGLRSYATHSGHDGVVVTGQDDGGNAYPEVHSAWFPEQIRSREHYDGGMDYDEDSMHFSEPEDVDDDGVAQMMDHIKKTYPEGVQVRLYRRDNGDLRLDHLSVPKEMRKQGIGSKIMQDLTGFADANGVRMTLTTGVKDPNFGTTSRARLGRFYKRFGFVDNRGKDFSISDNMLRNPAKQVGLSDGTGSMEDYEYFHLTPTRNVKSILANGLVPKRGARSKRFGEKQDGVYLFKNTDDANTALGSWYGEEFGENTPLTALSVKLPKAHDDADDASFEHVHTGVIEPSRISVLTDGRIQLGETVYRGEGEAYDKFDPEKISDQHAFGKAVYATTSKKIADMYADGPQPNVKFFGVPDNFKIFDVNAPAPDTKQLVHNALQDAIDNPKRYKVLGHVNDGGYIAPDHQRLMENAQDFLSMQPDGLPAHKYLNSVNRVAPGGSVPHYVGVVAHNHLGKALSDAGYDAARYKDFLDEEDHHNYAIFNVHGLNDSMGNWQITVSEPDADDSVKLYLMSATHMSVPMGDTSVDFSRKLQMSESSSTFYKSKEVMNGMARDLGVAQALSDAAVALGLPGNLSFQIMMDWENDQNTLNAALLAMLGFGLLQSGFNGTVDDAAGMILQRANYDAALLAENVLLPAHNNLYNADTAGKLKFAEQQGMTPVAPLYARHVDNNNESHFMGNPLLRSVGPQPVSSHTRVIHHSGSDKAKVSMVEFPHPDFDGKDGIPQRDADDNFGGYAYTTPEFYAKHGDDLAAGSGATSIGTENIIRAAKRALTLADHAAKQGVHDLLASSLHYRGFTDGDWSTMKPDSDAALYAVMGHRAFRPVLYANMNRDTFTSFMKGHFSAENLVSAHRKGLLPQGTRPDVESTRAINRKFLSMSPTEQATAHYDKQIGGIEKALEATDAMSKKAYGLQDKIKYQGQASELRSQLNAARIGKFDGVDAMAAKIASEQKLMSSMVDPNSFEDSEQDAMAKTISEKFRTHDWDNESVGGVYYENDNLTASPHGKILATASLAVSPSVLSRYGITRKDILTKTLGDGFSTEQESELNDGVPDQFQWHGGSLAGTMPNHEGAFKEIGAVSIAHHNAVKSLFRSFHVRGAVNSQLEGSRMRDLISSVAVVDASLSHLFKKVAVVVNADKGQRTKNGTRIGGFYDPMGHAIHVGPLYRSTVPHEVFHALDNCLAREIFGNVLDPDSIGIEFMTHAHDALNDPAIMARLKTKTSPERLDWARAFTDFTNDLSNHATFRADIDAEKNTIYSVSPHEIFARFGASFHAWATGGMDAVKKDNANGDAWPEHRFKRFVKLLQWRSLIDAKHPVVSPPEPASAEEQERHLAPVGG